MLCSHSVALQPPSLLQGALAKASLPGSGGEILLNVVSPLRTDGRCVMCLKLCLSICFGRVSTLSSPAGKPGSGMGVCAGEKVSVQDERVSVQT